MAIREYKTEDLDRLRQIHRRQALPYEFPDLSNPLFVSKLLVEDATGAVVMASLARVTCEMYLLVDPKARSPRDRYTSLVSLHAAGRADLLARGLDDAHAWLPPTLNKRFGRRLETLGWVRDDKWTPYCRRLAEI